MDKRSEVDRLLSEHHAVLVRKRKHQIWKFPDGKVFVRSSTPGDMKSDANNLSDLRLVLGIVPEHKAGERRPKTRTQGRSTSIHFSRSPNTGLADQLLLSGTAVSLLQDRIDVLERQNAELAAFTPCFLCRVRDWFGGVWR